MKTDCAALQWLKSKNENARVVRWVVKLSEFDLEIQHRKGRKSANVDGITRTPPPANDTYGKVDVENLYDTPMRDIPVTAITRGKKRAKETEKKGSGREREKEEREKGEREKEEREKEEREKEVEKREKK